MSEDFGSQNKKGFRTFAMTKIKSIKAFPLAYPEPHYKGIERYITLARVESTEGVAAFGVSAVDMALWDLAGKALGQPVATLLGGQVHDRASAMASFIFDMEDLDWTLNEFRWCREQGYRVVKAGWGMRPEAVFG